MKTITFVLFVFIFSLSVQHPVFAYQPRWFFMAAVAITSFHSAPSFSTYGPFSNKKECEEFRNWQAERGVKMISRCWSDSTTGEGR